MTKSFIVTRRIFARIALIKVNKNIRGEPLVRISRKFMERIVDGCSKFPYNWTINGCVRDTRSVFEITRFLKRPFSRRRQSDETYLSGISDMTLICRIPV